MSPRLTHTVGLLFLSACAIQQDYEVLWDSLSNKSGSLQCTTLTEFTDGAGMVGGMIGGRSTGYPHIGDVFADELIELRWSTEERNLDAIITNRATTPMSIDRAMLGPDMVSAPLVRASLLPGATATVRLGELHDLEEHLTIDEQGMATLQLALAVNVSGEGCRYNFKLAFPRRLTPRSTRRGPLMARRFRASCIETCNFSARGKWNRPRG